MGKKNYAYINPKMLVWARSETPFETTESVEMTFPAISAEKLKTWENGEDYPSITEAKKLASIYKLPFSAFYLSDEPTKKVKRYTDRRTLKGYYNAVTEMRSHWGYPRRGLVLYNGFRGDAYDCVTTRLWNQKQKEV